MTEVITTAAASTVPPESKYKKLLANAPPRPPPGVAFGYRLSETQLDAKAKELWGKSNSTAELLDRRISVVFYLRRLCPKWPMNDRFVMWRDGSYACICFHKLPPPDEIIDETKAMLVREGMLIDPRQTPRWYKLAE